MKDEVICAVKDDLFEKALSSKNKWIFDLDPDISEIEGKSDLSHRANKKYFIHFDLAAGIGKDKSGLLFVKDMGVDGIITTRVNIVKMAREAGLYTVQRFFIVDSHSVQTTLEGIKNAKPDMIEIMPGTLPKVIKGLKEQTSIPIIAGGLIETSDEIKLAFTAGASAISTTRTELWG
jgi:glycerol uptake operon antiterminator